MNNRGGIIIQNRGDGRGMMLPEREGSGAFNKLPFISMSCPKQELGIVPSKNIIEFNSKKNKGTVKIDKFKAREDRLDKLYPLENYRQLKTSEQFWKKNENPMYKEYNKNEEKPKKEEEKKMETEIERKINTPMKNPKTLKPIKKSNKIIIEENNTQPEIKPEIKIPKEKIKVNDEEEKAKEEEKKDEEEKKEDDENKDKEENEGKDPLLEEENENIDDILGYINNLDYDKYCKDMQIREALQLLKNKMNKEQDEKEKLEEKNKNKVTVNGVEQSEDNKEEPGENNNEEEEKENKDNKLVLPEITKKAPSQNQTEIVDEEELKKKEEIKKYKVAEQIAKSDQMKAVHSVNSIRKLLQREGLENIDQPPLKITIIKENPISTLDTYEPKKLPFLHSLPLV